MYSIKLQWKEFSVDLKAIDSALRGLYDNYAGNQAYSVLELWFTEEPSDSDKAAVLAYWAGIESDSSEAESYQSASDLETAKAVKRASGKAKLVALGLSEEEADALLG